MPSRRSSTSHGPYGRFARYYDEIYHDLVDYEGDVDFLEAAFRRYRSTPRTILDLGCGTGNHDFPLVRRGYRVIGVDRSASMLAVARRKAVQLSRSRARFVRGDMRTLALGVTFDAVICMFGAIGYVLTAGDLIRCFRRVQAHLAPKGLFVFEFWQGSAAKPAPHRSWVHTVGRRLEIIRLDEARFNPRTGRIPIDFHTFVFRQGRLIDRFTERHELQTHSVETIREFLNRGGFDLLGAFAATNVKKGFVPASPASFRVMVVARPRGES